MDERYQRGKIYRLTCDDPTMVYYGSTIQTLNKRLEKHTSKYNKSVSRKMRDAGGLQIHFIEDYPCNCRRDLEEREQYFIDNNECINKYNAFVTDEQRLETKRQWDKQYYKDNREKKLEYHKAYDKANREKIAEYQKAYREANREKVAEYKKAWRAAKII